MTEPSINDPKKWEISPEFLLSVTEAQSRLYGFLLKRLGDQEQAHEVLQEVNLVICKRGEEFVVGTNFMAWAFSIARFQLMAYRKRVSRDRLVFPEDLAAALDKLDSQSFSEESDQNRHIALNDCLKELSSSRRELLLKRYAESTSVKAIAADMNRTANSVSLLLHRIREQLMECIQRKLSEVH